MVTYLLKKSYQHKTLKEIKFKDLWGDKGVFTTMRILGKPAKIIFFKKHIKNLIKSLKVYKLNRINIEKNILDRPDLMKEGEIVTISINTEDGMPLSVDMPVSVILEVTHTEPGVKGNTATNATKPAKVETGARINVPLFINEGDKIKVDAEKGSYLERIKE